MDKTIKLILNFFGGPAGHGYTNRMSQLTRQDLEEVIDRKFEDFEERFEEKMDRKIGVFVEHIDDKFDGLAEAVSLMNSTMRILAKASDLQIVRQDIRTIKFAVAETNRDLRSYI